MEQENDFSVEFIARILKDLPEDQPNRIKKIPEDIRAHFLNILSLYQEKLFSADKPKHGISRKARLSQTNQSLAALELQNDLPFLQQQWGLRGGNAEPVANDAERLSAEKKIWYAQIIFKYFLSVLSKHLEEEKLDKQAFQNQLFLQLIYLMIAFDLFSPDGKSQEQAQQIWEIIETQPQQAQQIFDTIKINFLSK